MDLNVTAHSEGQWRRRLIWARNLETAAMVPFFVLGFLKLGTNIAALALFIVLTANLPFRIS